MVATLRRVNYPGPVTAITARTHLCVGKKRTAPAEFSLELLLIRV